MLLKKKKRLTVLMIDFSLEMVCVAAQGMDFRLKRLEHCTGVMLSDLN